MKSFDAYVEEALIECQYCTRRFNPKSLIPHQKACKINPMIKKPYVNKGPLGKVSEPEQVIKPASNYGYKQSSDKYDNGNQDNANLVPCRRCGRTFLADRVGKHEKVCKADPVDSLKPKEAAKFQKMVEPASKMKPTFGKQKKAKWKIQHE